MKEIKMKRNELGSNDGLVVLEFKADQVTMVSDELATVFVDQLKCATYTVDDDIDVEAAAAHAAGLGDDGLGDDFDDDIDADAAAADAADGLGEYDDGLGDDVKAPKASTKRGRK